MAKKMVVTMEVVAATVCSDSDDSNGNGDSNSNNSNSGDSDTSSSNKGLMAVGLAVVAATTLKDDYYSSSTVAKANTATMTSGIYSNK